MKLNFPLTGLAAACLFFAQLAVSEEFDTSLLAGLSRQADLSRLFAAHDIPAGQQSVDIHVNGDWKGRYTLALGENRGEISIIRQDAARLGIRVDEFQEGSLSIAELVRDGSYKLEASTMSLWLTVPQAYMARSESGYVDSEFWDHGLPAVLLGYNGTYYSLAPKKNGSSSDELYLGLETGINLSGWQFRDSSSIRSGSTHGMSWTNNTRYIRRSIAPISSSFRVGDFYSSGELFDSLRVRGAALASDSDMLPSSQQGFSPVVRGVARSNALVKVLQNGNVVYQENVAPGAFVLDALQSTGSAGDLTVIVSEADGSEQRFTVPFSAVPNMLKQGVSKYELIAASVNQATTDHDPSFIQGTYHRGLNNLITGYVGTVLSEDYKSYLLGSGWNLPIGALSLDLTHADTQLGKHRETGQSARITYSRFINATGTNFALGAYRYSTEGYYSFNEAIYSHAGYRELERRLTHRELVEGKVEDPLDLNTWDAVRGARPRNTFNLSVSQRLEDGWGSFYFSGAQRDYWSASGKSREYQFGYNNGIGKFNYNLSASRVRNSKRQEETTLYLSLSVPFDVAGNTAFLNTGASFRDSQYQQSNMSLSGTALESNRLNYTLAGSNQRNGSNMLSASGNYRTSVSTVGASYSESNDYRQAGMSARGSVVAIPGHILAANEMGSTMMVVEAPKAKGLMVNGDESILTNEDGVALVPYGMPYRVNSVTLSNTGSSSGAEIMGNVGNSVPYAGAVSHIRFETDQRQSYLLRVLREDGSALPFGAEVRDEKSNAIGFVGQASLVQIRAEKLPDSVEVVFGGGSCVVLYPRQRVDGAANSCQ